MVAIRAVAGVGEGVLVESNGLICGVIDFQIFVVAAAFGVFREKQGLTHGIVCVLKGSVLTFPTPTSLRSRGVKSARKRAA